MYQSEALLTNRLVDFNLNLATNLLTSGRNLKHFDNSFVKSTVKCQINTKFQFPVQCWSKSQLRNRPTHSFGVNTEE